MVSFAFKFSCNNAGISNVPRRYYMIRHFTLLQQNMTFGLYTASSRKTTTYIVVFRDVPPYRLVGCLSSDRRLLSHIYPNDRGNTLPQRIVNTKLPATKTRNDTMCPPLRQENLKSEIGICFGDVRTTLHC